METWVLGAIIALVGLLILACSAGHGEYGPLLPLAGIASTGTGSFVFIAAFKKWVKHF